ncbi:tail fiber domain protein [Escherichia coli]|nr:tail fiber domain protein [Escherichia coli]
MNLVTIFIWPPLRLRMVRVYHLLLYQERRRRRAQAIWLQFRLRIIFIIFLLRFFVRYIRTGIKRQMQRHVFFDTGGHQTGAAIILGFGSSADGPDGFPYCDIGGSNRRVNENASLKKMVMGMRVKSDQSTCAVSNGRISSETKTTWEYIRSTATIRIGGQTTAGLRHLFGHVRNFRLWHKELTDAQLGEVVE